ncbi:protein-glutamate O-methyltransferase CheR, partial [Candidatus Sumerlaeota bacterium]|nr:protein-glutamate O-methyltransferase CheR [Candidatus Sumerlaeota bacterium]
GGKRPFSEYYTASGEKVIFSPALRRNTYFAMHNLATDGPFNTFHLVLCRNVMIYFNRPLQDRVHLLLHESLEPRGFLGLGEKETIRFSSIEALYEKIEGGNQLYRRLA